MGQILLLEDDESLNRGICFKLEKEGYKVWSCRGMREGKRIFAQQSIDLIICDITLEDGDGLQFLRDIRKISDVRFVFLTAMDQEIDVVMGYEAGADDYITKPFSLSVLISKVHAIFKRIGGANNEKIESGRVLFLKSQMRVLIDGNETSFTKNELKLLSVFLDHPKQILAKQQLLEKIFDLDGAYADENTVAVYVKRLREKIETEDKPEHIKNVWGVGYLWDKECRRN